MEIVDFKRIDHGELNLGRGRCSRRFVVARRAGGNFRGHFGPRFVRGSGRNSNGWRRSRQYRGWWHCCNDGLIILLLYYYACHDS